MTAYHATRWHSNPISFQIIIIFCLTGCKIFVKYMFEFFPVCVIKHPSLSTGEKVVTVSYAYLTCFDCRTVMSYWLRIVVGSLTFWNWFDERLSMQGKKVAKVCSSKWLKSLPFFSFFLIERLSHRLMPEYSLHAVGCIFDFE